MFRLDTNKTLTSKEMSALINIYKAHQIFVNIFNEEFRTTQCLALSIGGLIMITMSYLLVGFYSQLPFFLFGTVAATLVLIFSILYFITKASAQLNKYSSIMLSCPAFLRNHQQRQFIGKIQTKRLKACKSLDIQLGNFATISMSTYPLFMYQVVFVGVVDLLLM